MSDENNRLRGLPGMGGQNTGLQINILSEQGRVKILFDKPVSMISIDAGQALGMAVALLNQVGNVMFPAQAPKPQPPPSEEQA